VNRHLTIAEETNCLHIKYDSRWLCLEKIYKNIRTVFTSKPILVAARSKAWVCGRSLDGIAGSNPARDMDVFLL